MWRGLTDSHELLHLRASVGGRYASSTRRTSTPAIRLARCGSASGRLNIRDRDLFFGVGNGGRVGSGGADPATSGGPTVRTRLARTCSLVGSPATPAHRPLDGDRRRRWGASDFYPGRAAPRSGEHRRRLSAADRRGLRVGRRLGRGDAELSFNTRRPGSGFLSGASVGKGLLLSLFGGYSAALGDGPWRFIAMARGSGRGRPLRRHAADLFRGCSTGCAGATIGSFTALSYLGGMLLLCGYDTDRFRDRVAALASAEYSWQLTDQLYASGFVHAGRVYSGPATCWCAACGSATAAAFTSITQRSLLRVQLARASTAACSSTWSDHVYDPLAQGDPMRAACAALLVCAGRAATSGRVRFADRPVVWVVNDHADIPGRPADLLRTPTTTTRSCCIRSPAGWRCPTATRRRHHGPR